MYTQNPEQIPPAFTNRSKLVATTVPNKTTIVRLFDDAKIGMRAQKQARVTWHGGRAAPMMVLITDDYRASWHSNPKSMMNMKSIYSIIVQTLLMVERDFTFLYVVIEFKYARII